MVECDDAARALGAVPSGLFIVTAGSGDAATGFLASFVQQSGFEPPTVSVAVKDGRHVGQLIRDGGAFCVAVLDDRSSALLKHFGRGFDPGQPAFEGLDVGTSVAGVPYPLGTLAHLECEVVGESTWSDHVMFCGRVVGGARREGDDQPLIHVRNNGLGY